MSSGRVHATPTGYGVIRIAERKRVVLASVAAPSLVRAPASSETVAAAHADPAGQQFTTARPASAG